MPRPLLPWQPLLQLQQEQGGLAWQLRWLLLQH
jgi:hypothetical protein